MDFRKSIFINVLVLLSFSVYCKDISSVISSYKNAKMVFSGKVIGIQELRSDIENDTDCFKTTLLVEFEIEKIYKGRCLERFIIIDTISVENKNYFSIEDKYLIYAIKNKTKKEVNYHTIRTRSFIAENTQTELEELSKYVDKKIFRRVKGPVPKYRFISGGCNC